MPHGPSHPSGNVAQPIPVAYSAAVTPCRPVVAACVVLVAAPASGCLAIPARLGPMPLHSATDRPSAEAQVATGATDGLSQVVAAGSLAFPLEDDPIEGFDLVADARMQLAHTLRTTLGGGLWLRTDLPEGGEGPVFGGRFGLDVSTEPFPFVWLSGALSGSLDGQAVWRWPSLEDGFGAVGVTGGLTVEGGFNATSGADLDDPEAFVVPQPGLVLWFRLDATVEIPLPGDVALSLGGGFHVGVFPTALATAPSTQFLPTFGIGLRFGDPLE